MAKVTSEDRKKTGFDDGSYPMSTGAQVRSAIKLRHHSKAHSAASVLAKASSAISRLLKTGKISPATAKALRAAVERARQADAHSK